MRKNLFIFGLLLCLSAPPAWALRCGTQLVQIGDYKLEVLRKCGEPMLTDSRVEYRAVRLRNPGLDLERYVPVTIDEWAYNFGPNRFMQLLRFENGRLVGIESLSYGE